MVVNIAPELNGARLYVPNTPDVWLVVHGVLRRVSSPVVYDALFSNTEGLVAMASVDAIQRGADLNEGALLARPEGENDVFLVTGAPDTEVLKHHVATYETFKIYGFDETKIRDVPRLVLGGVPSGAEIRCDSAPWVATG